MQVPLRIYYDTNGTPIIMTGNFTDRGLYEIPSVAFDVLNYQTLSERNRETFNVLELPFGAYAQDFAEATGYRVNPETLTLEFSYPDQNEPEAPPVFQPPLTEQVLELKTKQVETNKVVAEITAAQRDLLELLIEMEVI